MEDHVPEEKRACIKRLKRLFEVASLQELEDTERDLRKSIGSRVGKRNKKNQNPTGSKAALPCKQCGGERPPAQSPAAFPCDRVTFCKPG